MSERRRSRSRRPAASAPGLEPGQVPGQRAGRDREEGAPPRAAGHPLRQRCVLSVLAVVVSLVIGGVLIAVTEPAA